MKQIAIVDATDGAAFVDHIAGGWRLIATSGSSLILGYGESA